MSIANEEFGDPADPAVLPVMGFGSQMIAWHEDFCRALARRGRHVIRYDNRDCGLSTTFDDPCRHGPVHRRGELALGIERAHVVGSSIGGMIAQTMAISRPERVLTLTSMMSWTGESEYGRVGADAQAVLFSPRPADRERYIAAAAKKMVWASKRYGSPALLRGLAVQSYDRAYRPSGIGRQLGAMILGGSRADALREFRVPTLVPHGLDGTLIDPSGGSRTADLAPGAKLVLIPDMGHDRPRELWPEIIDTLDAHTR
ncbi:alpha/beta fold hydrolase [Streptomyces sp. NBC_01283]|uniref:alpha/beta fold hydrolase n=1 Tax=Streptomyces sp. NBC_01283 TaxID=2903812 RepID=UPI00352F2447|nr:alpha/beta fold hydrolase [Streptomyces sp. NBC_01283]